MTSTDPFDALEAVIRSRRGGDAKASYVAALFEKGRPKIAQKVGEEAVEAAIAAVQGDRGALKGEAADLIFHLIVLLVDAGLRLDDVRAELVRREGLSGLVEKASRTAPPPAAVAEAAATATGPRPLGHDEPEAAAAPLRHDAEKPGSPRPLPPATGGF